MINRIIAVTGDAIPLLADGSEALTLRRIVGKETLSEPFKYQLDLTTSLDMPADEAANLNLEKMTGREVTVTIQPASENLVINKNKLSEATSDGKREISGIVTEATLVEKMERVYLYRLVIEPWIVLAKKRSDYRIFQKKTVVEIIDEVLSSQYTYPYIKRLNQNYVLLEYEVQYGESDYDFIQRLMERHGIYWFFDHSRSFHRMVLIDNMGGHTPVSCPAYHTLSYHSSRHRPDQEVIYHFGISERIHSGCWTSGDYNFTQPGNDLRVHNAQPKNTPYNYLAIYEWPGNYADSLQGDKYACVRMEDIQARSWYASGNSNLRNIVCGTTFNLEGYPQRAANQEYLVISAKLDAEERAESSESPGSLNSADYQFETVFEVQPTTMPYRPERKTPEPRTTGPQTAIVTGPPGLEIWTDQYGRVKLKFHWDRSPVRDHNSSCWIRVSYPWAGSNFGGINIPRIGTEVIVDFENGDPNRPIVTGRVYNAATMPPWALPGNATQSGLISRTIGGAVQNANALRFEDAPGLEQLWMQAERDMLTEIKNNENHNVGANRNKSIGGDETSDIKGTRTESVAGDESIELQANRSRSVAQNDRLDIGGNQQTSIQGNRQHSVRGDSDSSVGGNASLSVSGNRRITVNQGQETAVQQDLSEQANGNRSTQVGKTYSVDVGDKFELIVGSASLVLESNGNIYLNGKEISVNGSDAVAINANMIDLN
ncbi:type VI secretion system Vgr family protein [Pantoea sp.]|uniref:type VI secretion system Vgr family protein n=1 Tax=Pantoea sp. TaxID=69393 RepID=UPI0028A0E0BF|nr:type VI secretion system tip protein TssI/VgrG [Pantoea sp.]